MSRAQTQTSRYSMCAPSEARVSVPFLREPCAFDHFPLFKKALPHTRSRFYDKKVTALIMFFTVLEYSVVGWRNCG